MDAAAPHLGRTMTPYVLFLLAVYDQDLDQPLPCAGAHLRQALAKEHVTQHPTLRPSGEERPRPVKIATAGTEYLRGFGLTAETK